ncbi:retrovirus-related pol polyprotein from transposon TNT 1-94 [Tanacetum coccineum]
METVLRHCYVMTPNEYVKTMNKGDDVFFCEYEYDVKYHSFKRIAEIDNHEEDDGEAEHDEDWSCNEDSESESDDEMKRRINLNRYMDQHRLIISHKQTTLEKAKATLLLSTMPKSLPYGGGGSEGGGKGGGGGGSKGGDDGGICDLHLSSKLTQQKFSNQIKENESLLQTFNVFKKESKEKESKYMDKEIDLEKKIKELDNIVYKVGQSAQIVHMLIKPQVFYDGTYKKALGYQNPFYLKKARRIKPTLYDGSVISRQHDVIPVTDEEEKLILEEVSQSKMLAKQNDPISIEHKINVSPRNYAELNQLSEDFGKCFVPQQELSAEQAFWLQTSHSNSDQSDISPVKIEAPRELPKCSVDKQCFKIHKKELFLDNDQLLHQIMSQDVMLCVMNSTAAFGDFMNLGMKISDSYNKCLDLEAELVNWKNMVERDVYTDLLNRFARLENIVFL